MLMFVFGLSGVNFTTIQVMSLYNLDTYALLVMQVSFGTPCFCIYVKTYFEVCVRNCARQGRCVVKTQSLL